jgi:dihydroflavonol-4-reductase
VSGPAPPAKPAREEDAPQPISEYGKSKLAAEMEILRYCKVPYTILRPPAVYGPRDYAFFPLFQAIHRHILPRPSATQSLSIVYGPDLAEGVVACLDHPAAAGKTYFVASEEIATARLMGDEIAARMHHWTLPCPVPSLLLWPVCLAQEIISRTTGRPMLLNLQKYAELRAPGWVCDPTKLKRETGYESRTPLKTGVAATLEWYKQNQWLR